MGFRASREFERAPSRMALLLRLSFLTCLLGLHVAAASVAGHVRGVAPEDLHHFQKADIFNCRDGNGQIPYEQVNDDYCDCVDGSDEPGTSACSNGRFYCYNFGHLPITVPSSRVNDGICDCCDGSDEFEGRIKCKNTCLEAGAEFRTKLKRDAHAYAEGAKLRAEYITEAKRLRQSWEKELEELKAQKAVQEKAVQEAAAKKEELEAKEKAWQEQEKKRQEEAQKDQQEEEPQQQEEIPSAETTQDLQDPPEQTTNSDKIDSDDVHESAVEAAKELSADEVGRLVASRWTGHSEGVEFAEEADAAVRGQELPGTEGEDEKPEEDRKPGEDGKPEEDEKPEEDGKPEQELDEEEEEEEEEKATPVVSLIQKVSDLSGALVQKAKSFFAKVPAVAVQTSEVEAARAHWNERNRMLADTTQKANTLEAKLRKDFGPDEVFLKMADECFELTVKQYVYSVCPFSEATQKEGHSSTRLGSWDGFHDNFTTMKFTNGMHCWNGPQRSITVHMKCGLKNELTQVDEPSRCEYAAELLTPAVCTTAEAKGLRERLEEAERLVKKVKEEL